MPDNTKQPAHSPSAEPETMREAPALLDGLTAETLVRSIRAENFIGKGGAHSAFRIDGHPDLVIRIQSWLLASDAKTLEPEYAARLSHITPLESDLGTLPFGQAIADVDGVLTVNLMSKGQTLRAPDSTPPAEAKAHYLAMLQKAAEMDSGAYVQLLKEATLLQEKGYDIDPKPTNLLIDAEGGRFNIIDFHKAKSGQGGAPSTGLLLTMLTDGTSRGWYHAETEAKPFIQAIEDKMKAAAQEVGIPFQTPPKPPPPPPIRPKEKSPSHWRDKVQGEDNAPSTGNAPKR